ncbi:MAG: 2Fe-2S iron-sulfur cluster-binding protein, partial [Pseudomonadota bacterium]
MSEAALDSGPVSDREHLVVFTPSGKRGRFAHGTPVLQAARKLGVDLDSVCGGRGICGRCQVTVALGTFPKHGLTSAHDHVSPSGAVEARYEAKRGPLKIDHRLGCQAKILGDLVVDIPPDSQVHRQLVRKDVSGGAIAIDPVIRLHMVT